MEKQVFTDELAAEALPGRRPDGHKGDFGRVSICLLYTSYLCYDTSGDYITGCGPDAAASSINYLHKVKWRNEKMAKIYYQEDCNLSLLDGKTIAVIGYGSQGHAQALNCLLYTSRCV